MEKYIQMAKDMNMLHAVIISPDQIHFDIRGMLKCRWGCLNYQSQKCSIRDTTLKERWDMISAYEHILLVHSHEARAVTQTILAIERQAFLDGYYWAFALACCNYCKECLVKKEQTCPFPDLIRPCDQSFGLDMYKTIRGLGLPIHVLQNQDEAPDRYGFVLIV